MPMTRGVKVTRGCPSPGRRVVEFRAAGSKAAAVVLSASNQNHPVLQQGRCMVRALDVKATSGCPGSANWMVQFCARGREAAAIISTRNQNLPVC